MKPAWLVLFGLVACVGDGSSRIPNDAFIGGSLRLARDVVPPQSCVLRLAVPFGAEQEPIFRSDLPDQGVNLQHPLGTVDDPRSVFWLTESDAELFIDEVEFGWHAWIVCDRGLVVSEDSAWGAYGGDITEPFTPPRTDLDIEVDYL